MSTNKIFINANIITMNKVTPTAEAIGISGDTISVVGTNSDVQSWGVADVEVIDVGGKTIIPGLIESHSHISAGALFATSANCLLATRVEEALELVSGVAHQTEPDQWVQGIGFDDTGVVEMRHLNRQDLDAVSTKHPICVYHISHHIAYVNSKALELAGIDASTPNPSGGTIVKDERGEPTGVLEETACFSMVKLIPQGTRAFFKEQMVKMIAGYNAVGLTGNHDPAIGMAGETVSYLNIARELEQAGNLNLRIYGDMLDEVYEEYDRMGVSKGFGTNAFKIGGRKLFQDGSIQAFTGCLLEGYHTRPDWKGELISPQEELNQMICAYHKNGDQVVIHGNGDGAIESILQAFELAQQQFPRKDPRHMLIHCQMASDDHIERMMRLGIIPSYFINHVYYWGDRHKELFIGPERAARINPLGSSERAGMIYSMHTDFPVTPFDPWRALHTAVNRETSGGQILGEAECISPLQALRGYTLYAAMCSFEEDIKGSLEVGKLADLVVISDDPLTMGPKQIKDIQVLRTVVGGRTVYEQ